MSISKKTKNDCCGCNACAEICPKHCIQMEEDREGFAYPHVNHKLCVECGACENVCPFGNENLLFMTPMDAYAAWNKIPQIHQTSTSGGAAYTFSKYIIENGGIVYGCAFEKNQAKHIRIDNLADLSRLQGSKYVQSCINGIFRKIKTDVKSDINVLFIGTPCQVAALQSYIGKVPENLYLIDLICHGVPSPKMLKEHIRNVIGEEGIRRISFRKGNKYIFEVEGHEKFYRNDLWNNLFTDSFMTGFIYGIINRPSCSHCPFARPERCSDITIGDFWGIHNWEQSSLSPIQDGVSILLPCTRKGMNLLYFVQKELCIFKSTLQEAIHGNIRLRQPMNNSLRTRIFHLAYKYIPFHLAVEVSLLDLSFPYRLKRKIKRIVNR